MSELSMGIKSVIDCTIGNVIEQIRNGSSAKYPGREARWREELAGLAMHGIEQWLNSPACIAEHLSEVGVQLLPRRG